MRASDADRSAVAEALRAQCVAGRLQVEELEQRLAAALLARTVGELQRLVSDLPAGYPIPASALRPAPAKVKPGLPGVRSFHQAHELDVDRERCFRQALAYVLPMMVAGGFDVIDRAELELLAFQRDHERVVLAFNESAHGGTRLTVQGTACRRVRKVFAKLAG